MTNINTALENTLGFGIEEFVKKAIEGGWKKPFITNTRISTLARYKTNYSVILLDPKSWQAVGKTEGWKEKIEDNVVAVSYAGRVMRGNDPEWLENMHRFIDALAEEV